VLELRQRQVRRIGMAADVFFGAWRRLPGVVVGAGLAISTGLQRAQHVGRTPVDCHRIGDDVGRTDAVPREQRMQPRQRIDVLKALIGARGGIPLVVAFRVDADEQVHCALSLVSVYPCLSAALSLHPRYLSWSESPSVTCQRSVLP